jgi:hypothetical protein
MFFVILPRQCEQALMWTLKSAELFLMNDIDRLSNKHAWVPKKRKVLTARHAWFLHTHTKKLFSPTHGCTSATSSFPVLFITLHWSACPRGKMHSSLGAAYPARLSPSYSLRPAHGRPVTPALETWQLWGKDGTDCMAWQGKGTVWKETEDTGTLSLRTPFFSVACAHSLVVVIILETIFDYWQVYAKHNSGFH